MDSLLDLRSKLHRSLSLALLSPFARVSFPHFSNPYLQRLIARPTLILHRTRFRTLSTTERPSFLSSIFSSSPFSASYTPSLHVVAHSLFYKQQPLLCSPVLLFVSSDFTTRYSRPFLVLFLLLLLVKGRSRKTCH